MLTAQIAFPWAVTFLPYIKLLNLQIEQRATTVHEFDANAALEFEW